MILAKKLRESNIAEYLLYMWQIEDILRASKLDIDKIERKIISKYEQSEEMMKETKDWYEGLIEMMRLEDRIESGHLIINNNIILELSSLHNHLLDDAEEAEYKAIYYKTLPFIVELRSKMKSKKDTESEIETCFNALYGFLLLKLQEREISGETQAAVSQISTLLRHLSFKFKVNEEKGLHV